MKARNSRSNSHSPGLVQPGQLLGRQHSGHEVVRRASIGNRLVAIPEPGLHERDLVALPNDDPLGEARSDAPAP